MALTSTTLRPGLLVSLRTSINGNITYSKRILETVHTLADGTTREMWETVKTITDPEEYARAEKARNAASQAIRSVCAASAFGLLCREADADQLDAAIKAARTVARDFNDSAALSRVTVHVITGRIAPDDVEAVKAINAEMAGLLQTMTDGVRNLDVKAIREAASRAKSLGVMLPAEVSARAQAAIDAARAAARQIKKAGETAAATIDTRAIRNITEARTAFLDLDASGNEVDAIAPTGRAIDLDPSDGTSMAASAPQAPTLDLF